MTTFYLVCAVAGGTLFLLRSLLLFAGFGGDADVPAEVPAGDVSGGESMADFHLFSVHGVTAFFLMFGLAGWLLSRGEAAWSPVGAAAAAVAAGAVTLLLVAKIFSASRKLQSDGTVRLADAAGAEGAVYLEIRPGATGQVRVTARGALKVFDARAKDPAARLPTDTPIRVVAVEDVLVVEPR